MTKSPTDSEIVEELAELRETVERLTQMIDVLTSAVDEVANLLQWHINNASRDLRPEPVMLKSMPVDPTAKDWKLDRATAADAIPVSPPVTHPAKQTLFD